MYTNTKNQIPQAISYLGVGGMPLVKSSKMFKSLKFNPAFLKLGDIRIQIPLSLLYSSPMCQPIVNTFNYFEIQCYHGNS